MTLVRRHAVRELQSARASFGSWIGLESSEIRDDSVGHLLEREVFGNADLGGDATVERLFS